jgi:hypothetical protein
VTRRSRGEQSDHRFASVVAEEKDEPLSPRGNLLGEPKTGGSNFITRQPDVAPIVARRRLALERRNQRQKSAA